MGDLDPAFEHVVTGNTVEEVMQKSFEHAKVAHAKALATMSSPEQMKQMETLIRSKITSA